MTYLYNRHKIHDYLKLVIIAFCVLSAVFIYVTYHNQASAVNQFSMDGYFNIGEKFYQNGTFSYEYYLFVNNGTHGQTPYYLKFTNPQKSLFSLTGKHVHVVGHMAAEQKYSKFISDSKEVYADTITSNQNQTISKLVSDSSPPRFTSPLTSVIILLQYIENSTQFPHSSTYYQNRFYNDPDSLNAYWTHTSYGSLSLSGQVVNWQVLPKTKAQYTDSSGFFLNQVAAGDAVALADPTVNFNGIQQVFFAFNDKFPDPSNGAFAFAYTSPLPITTSEGTKMVLEEFIPDTGAGFAVDRSYFNGVGVVAHEMGHNLGWLHTPPPPPAVNPYLDPWSLMSGAGNPSNPRIFGVNNGTVGAISYNRDQAGWIPPANKVTIPVGQQKTFTLDVLDVTTPGSNYLMGIIPFGSAGSYLTLEARTNSTFDFTPTGQMGLLIYNYSSTGHPENVEPTDNVNIVDISGTGDWKNDDLHAGGTYTWAKYNIVITDVSQTANTITVSVSNNMVCTPNTSPWDIASSCTLTSSSSAPGDVIIEPGAVLTIPNGLTLNIDFINHHLLVKSGGGVLVKAGGKLN